MRFRNIAGAFVAVLPIAVPAASLTALPAAPARAQVSTEAQPSTIEVNATQTISAAPDEAYITIGVTTEDDTAAEAMAGNTARMQAVYEALAAAGIEADDITTIDVSMQPRYTRGGQESAQRIEGYMAANTVRIRVAEIDGLGAALDAVVRAGVNQVSRISFSIADTSELEARARSGAAAMLRTKAEQYAAALGTEVRGVLRISEQMVYDRPQPMARMAMAEMASAVPVSAGDVEVQVTLHGTFEIDSDLK